MAIVQKFPDMMVEHYFDIENNEWSYCTPINKSQYIYRARKLSEKGNWIYYHYPSNKKLTQLEILVLCKLLTNE